jgi:hypothetical protein
VATHWSGWSTQWPAAIPIALRHPDPIEIFQHLNGQVSPNAAQAVEIGRGKCALRMLGGKLSGDPLEFFERCWQEIAIFCDPMHPAELLGAGEKRFKGRKSNSDMIDQLSHPWRTRAVGGESGSDAFPEGIFCRRGLCPVAGKMIDGAAAGNDAGRAKLRDGTAQQRSRDRRSESRVNTGFIEPEQFRVRAVMSTKRLYGLVKQCLPMIGMQGDPRARIMAELDRVDGNERPAFGGRQIPASFEDIKVKAANRCLEHALEGCCGVGCAERIEPYQAHRVVLARRRQRIEYEAAAEGMLRRLIAQDELLHRPSGNGLVEVKRRNGGFAGLDGLGREERDAASEVLSADMQMGRSPMAERPFTPEQAQLDFDALGRLVPASDDPNTAPQIIKPYPGQLDGAAVARLRQ